MLFAHSPEGGWVLSKGTGSLVLPDSRESSTSGCLLGAQTENPGCCRGWSRHPQVLSPPQRLCQRRGLSV